MLGVKNADTYLPTDDEVKTMIQQGQEAARNHQPTPDEQSKIAQAQLNVARAKEIDANVAGSTAKSQLDYMAQAQGNPKVYS